MARKDVTLKQTFLTRGTDTPMPAPSPLAAVTFRVYSKNVNNKLGCALWKSGVRRSDGDGAAG